MVWRRHQHRGPGGASAQAPPHQLRAKPRTTVPATAALLALTGTAAVAWASPFPNLTGPPPGHTGGFGEPTCAVCHNEFGVNELGGRLLVEGLPAAYAPGESYAVTVRLETDGMEVGGFQMAARFSGGAEPGAAAGSWEPLDARVTVTVDSASGIPYAQQTPAGSAVSDPTLATWTVLWHAPTEGGSVTLNAAANSGNDDNSPFGDLIYTFDADVPAGAASLRGQGVPGIHPGGAPRR